MTWAPPWEHNKVTPHYFHSLGPLILPVSGKRLPTHWHFYIPANIPCISWWSCLLTQKAVTYFTQLLLHAKGPVPLLCNLSIWSSDRKKETFAISSECKRQSALLWGNDLTEITYSPFLILRIKQQHVIHSESCPCTACTCTPSSFLRVIKKVGIMASLWNCTAEHQLMLINQSN